MLLKLEPVEEPPGNLLPLIRSVGRGPEMLHFSQLLGHADAIGPWTPQPGDRETQMSDPSAESEELKQDGQGRAGGQWFSYQRFYSNAEKGQTDKDMSETGGVVQT